MMVIVVSLVFATVLYAGGWVMGAVTPVGHPSMEIKPEIWSETKVAEYRHNCRIVMAVILTLVTVSSVWFVPIIDVTEGLDDLSIGYCLLWLLFYTSALLVGWRHGTILMRREASYHLKLEVSTEEGGE